MYSIEGRSGCGKSFNAIKIVQHFIASENSCFGFCNVSTNFCRHTCYKENGYKKLSQLVAHSFISNTNRSHLLIDPQYLS